VPEGNVIELVRKDSAIQFVLGNLHKSFVLYGRCKSVCYEHVVMRGGDFDLIKGFTIFLGFEHIWYKVEDRIPDLNPLILVFVCRYDLCRVIGKDFVW
jgi:hypothetical protein